MLRLSNTSAELLGVKTQKLAQNRDYTWNRIISK